MGIAAIVTAGDRRAAKAVYGESKVYLEIGGKSLVERVVATLQRVPEISEVWVVGNAPRLEEVLGREEVQRGLCKPLHIVPQFRNLYENAWQTYRRILPGAGPEGRDPLPEDADVQALFLSADLPFATAEEISEFVRRGQEVGADYILGLVTEESMKDFYPAGPGEPGIHMAYFNVGEGRFRQSNLHLVRPARLTNRTYIEEMYENRYQKEFGNIVKLAWRLLSSEEGGLSIMIYYCLMQLASLADRRGWQRIADRVRSWIPLARVEATLSRLLRTSLRIVVTEAGGCAVDIDNEADYDACRERFEAWRSAQQARAEKLYGSPALAEGPRGGAAPRPREQEE